MTDTSRPAARRVRYALLELEYVPATDWVELRALDSGVVYGHVLRVNDAPRLVLAPDQAIMLAALPVVIEFATTCAKEHLNAKAGTQESTQAGGEEGSE